MTGHAAIPGKATDMPPDLQIEIATAGCRLLAAGPADNSGAEECRLAGRACYHIPLFGQVLARPFARVLTLEHK